MVQVKDLPDSIASKPATEETLARKPIAQDQLLPAGSVDVV